MTQRILIIDSDRAFATALQEQLRDEASITSHVAYGGAQALRMLREHSFDLTILDLGVDSDEFDDDDTRVQAALALLPQIRAIQPEMRFILIPLIGEDLPAQAADMEIEGTLAKPFFLDELLAQVGDAQAAGAATGEAKPVPKPAAEPKPMPKLDAEPKTRPARPLAEPVRAERSAEEEIRQILFNLVHETSADAAVLVGPGGLTIQQGVLDAGRAQALAEQVRYSLEASRQMSQFLEGESQPLAHQILEGSRYRLYVWSLPPAYAAAVLTPVGIPLGVVRVSLRRAGRALQQLITALFDVT